MIDKKTDSVISAESVFLLHRIAAKSCIYRIFKIKEIRRLEVLQVNDVSFDDYKNWFREIKNKDPHEIHFQSKIVERFISILCRDLDVYDCSKKVQDSQKHDYDQYCGRKDGKAATPDLVIAKGWNWENIKNTVDYRAVVEVKSPFTGPIYHKDYEEYGAKLKEELDRHLSAKKNSKLILTDTLKWEFYERGKKTKTFKLYELSKGGKWEWKQGEKGIVEDEVMKELFGPDLKYEKPVHAFEELKNYLKEFLESK